MLRIPRLYWYSNDPDRGSPFCYEESRALKLTIHDSSFSQLPDSELKAYELLKELGRLSELDVLQFLPGDHLHIQLKNETEGYVDIFIENGDGWQQGYIEIKELAWTRCASEHEERECLELLAHRKLRRDIFITMSDYLISKREGFSNQNILTPTEALKVVGLFLRSRNNWTYLMNAKGSRAGACKESFYWILMRHKLPNMWSYHSACAQTGGYDSSLMNLSSSVLDRCYTVLQARDEIGKQFYGDADHETILYHFNYLFLLITGVLDAQARIIHENYSFNGSAQHTGFTKKEFLKKLQKHVPAVHKVVTKPENEALIKLLHNLRNTIHGSGHKAHEHQFPGAEKELDIELSNEIAVDVLAAAEKLGCTRTDGIYKHELKSFIVNGVEQGPKSFVHVEPYNFASYLIDHAFKLFDEIAKETKVSISDTSTPLTSSMPDDWVFRASRFDLLGG